MGPFHVPCGTGRAMITEFSISKTATVAEVQGKGLYSLNTWKPAKNSVNSFGYLTFRNNTGHEKSTTCGDRCKMTHNRMNQVSHVFRNLSYL